MDNSKAIQWQNVNADLKFRLKMGQWGWADLIFDHQETLHCIALSDVYDPFKDLVYWVDDIAQDRLPAVLDIDEEVQVARLEAMKISDKMVKLGVRSLRTLNVYFETQVDKVAFARAFQIEIRRFFAQEFDASHWHSVDSETHQVSLKDWILAHEWR